MIHIWTDGACDADTRNGGWAAVIEQDKALERLSGAVYNTTNNRMEYTAIVQALEWLYLKTPPEEHIVVHTDSKLVVGHVLEGHKVNKNADLVNKVKNWVESESTPHVTIVWHPRNSNDYLSWCDKQAKYEKETLDLRGPRKLKSVL